MSFVTIDVSAFGYMHSAIWIALQPQYPSFTIYQSYKGNKLYSYNVYFIWRTDAFHRALYKKMSQCVRLETCARPCDKKTYWRARDRMVFGNIDTSVLADDLLGENLGRLLCDSHPMCQAPRRIEWRYDIYDRSHFIVSLSIYWMSADVCGSTRKKDAHRTLNVCRRRQKIRYGKGEWITW